MNCSFGRFFVLAQGTAASAPNWLTLSLDTSLGMKANIFQIQPNPVGGTAADQKKDKTTTTQQQQLGASPGQISLHQQAAPVVSRQVLDTLIFLAKFFPGAFWPTKLAVAEGGKDPKDPKDPKDKGKDDKDKDKDKEKKKEPLVSSVIQLHQNFIEFFSSSLSI
jgi:hypothetical protein